MDAKKLIKRDSELMRQIGGRLRAERLRLDLSASSVATALGVVRLTSWETGSTLPNLLHLHKLRELGFDVEFILSGTSVQRSREVDLDTSVLRAASRAVNDVALDARVQLTTEQKHRTVFSLAEVLHSVVAAVAKPAPATIAATPAPKRRRGGR